MPRRTQNMFSMSRGRIRTSMKKQNLFNLYKKPQVNYNGKTLFQQKWLGKQETRAYHGEHLTESRWKSIFDPNLESVAQLDASLKGENVEPTKLSLQSYAVLEKRLEFALFRAMFASSIRQARQFILGGHVKVNDVTMKHPSFPLQEGDVFSVTPDKVLMAMGRPKPSLEKAIKVDNKQIAAWNKFVATARKSPKEMWELQQTRPKSMDSLQGDRLEELVGKFNESIEKDMKLRQVKATRENILLKIIALGNEVGTESLVPETFNELGEKNAEKCFKAYQKLSEFKHPILKKATHGEASKFINTKQPEFENVGEAKVTSQVKQILSELVKDRQEHIRVSAEGSKLPEHAQTIPYSPKPFLGLQFRDKLDGEKIKEDESVANVKFPWQSGLFGRADPSKPYFTPWKPRGFIGCFAILPSHIEVSFSTCHAVYLRDPVARPGHSEVITPFPDHVHERAYMYYARKGL